MERYHRDHRHPSRGLGGELTLSPRRKTFTSAEVETAEFDALQWHFAETSSPDKVASSWALAESFPEESMQATSDVNSEPLVVWIHAIQSNVVFPDMPNVGGIFFRPEQCSAYSQTEIVFEHHLVPK